MLARTAAWISVLLCFLQSGTVAGFLESLDRTESSSSTTASTATESPMTTSVNIPTRPTTTHRPPTTTVVPPTLHTASKAPTISVSMTSMAPQTTAATLMSTSTTGGLEVCEDTMPSCYQYGRGPCNDPVYQSWARAHCALYCGFCNTTSPQPLQCKNRVGNCDEYDDGHLCSSPAYYSWAYENCKGYCKFEGCSGNCTDSLDFDCLAVSGTTDVCGNRDLWKPFCPRFCGFCDVVDGNWAVWSAWSQCDVTCDNGTQVRTRTCTDPPPSPAHGSVPAGLPCEGGILDTQTCTMDLCPVHGAWGNWSVWGECSVTCDVGMQRRGRHCNNPSPDRNGDHCFGEGAAYRICLPGACADGDWSNWGEWSNCSAECVRHRNRTCDNPPPSPLGRGCQGNHKDTETCIYNNDGFSNCTDGGWSGWSGWSSCSVTCGDGFKTRDRQCNNPLPSPYGRECPGNSKDISACHNSRCACQSCRDVKSAFSVSSPSTIRSNKLVFSTTIYNYGGDYSLYTGTFTCSKPGVYYFSVSLTKKRTSSRSFDMIYCHLYKNSGSVLYLLVDPTDDDTDKGSTSISNSAVQHLNRGDTVSLQRCTGASTMESYSSFTGFLLYADP